MALALLHSGIRGGRYGVQGPGKSTGRQPRRSLHKPMNIRDEELFMAIVEVVRNRRKAERIIQRYFSDKIIIVWKTEDVHRAAQELDVALTKKQAMTVLETLHRQHNAQFGLKWEDVTTHIQENVLGRKMTRKEIDQFVKKDI